MPWCATHAMVHHDLVWGQAVKGLSSWDVARGLPGRVDPLATVQPCRAVVRHLCLPIPIRRRSQLGLARLAWAVAASEPHWSSPIDRRDETFELSSPTSLGPGDRRSGQEGWNDMRLSSGRDRRGCPESAVLSLIHRVSHSCLLTKRHIGVAAVFIVTRVGIAIRAD